MNQNTFYNAIVVGTGITGGWAAKEFCQNGLNTLVLERGPMVEHIQDYKTMNDALWDLSFKGNLSREDKKITTNKKELIRHPRMPPSIFL